MAGGFRSRIGFWLGGLAGASAPAPTGGGHRSRFGFWLGGLSGQTAAPPAPQYIGYPSYFLPWYGGVGTLPSGSTNTITGSVTLNNNTMRGVILMTDTITIDERYLFEFPLR